MNSRRGPVPTLPSLPPSPPPHASVNPNTHWTSDLTLEDTALFPCAGQRGEQPRASLGRRESNKSIEEGRGLSTHKRETERQTERGGERERETERSLRHCLKNTEGVRMCMCVCCGCVGVCLRVWVSDYKVKREGWQDNSRQSNRRKSGEQQNEKGKKTENDNPNTEGNQISQRL